jgi:hypothetical protein
MGLFNRLFGERSTGSPAYGERSYGYPTGNLELMIRHEKGGEDLMVVLEQVREQWKPGNEYLWDDFDPESLVDTEERRRYSVNQLLYSRICLSRALRAAGRDIRGRDPFEIAAETPEVVARLRDRFPEAADWAWPDL